MTVLANFFSSLVRPWKVSNRRNVLTRNGAQQSLEHTHAVRERERGGESSSLRTSAFPSKYWYGAFYQSGV